MKITLKEQIYLGYRQGWKVYIDGIKYPKMRSYWYTDIDPIEALKQAKKDHRGGLNQ